ncbi:MAG TPA: AAA family ATPase [Alphaproteobacteria bacterium]|nr:AAA family ATPase [Alphaproteobacteria bacterium]
MPEPKALESFDPQDESEEAASLADSGVSASQSDVEPADARAAEDTFSDHIEPPKADGDAGDAIDGEAFADIQIDNGGSIAAMAFVTDVASGQAIATRFQERSLSAVVKAGGVRKSVELFQQGPSPRLLIIDLSGLDQPMNEIDALAEVCEPGTTVVAVGDQNDVGLYRRLTLAGITDYLVKPLTAEAIDLAIETAAGVPTAASESAATGKVIAFIGAHGGVGTTTLAVNTAWTIATEMGKQVAIVDLDLKFGAVSLALDVEPGRGLREALQHPERIDGLFVAGAAVGISDRLYVLGSEEPLEDGVEFHSDALELLLTELRRSFDVVVLDIPRALAVQQQAALADATVAVVSDMTLLGVRDTLRLNGFAKRAYADGKIITVINRVGGDRKGEVPRGDFEKGIEGKVDVIVPEDKKTLAIASHAGKAIATIAKRSKVANAMREIAKAALPPEDGGEQSDKKSKKDGRAEKDTGDTKDKKERQPLWRRKKEK